MSMLARRNKARTVLLLIACSAAAQEQSVFRAGTRLVEVDVVVRDKNGPVHGLTKDDFTLFDCASLERSVTRPFAPCKGKRQPLEVFREVNGLVPPGAAPVVASSIPLAPGAVSNRVYADGKPLASATVVLFDQLNTPFDLKEYQRGQVAKFLQSVGDKDRIALYSLGQDLHILQDFTDDPLKLIHAVAKLDSGDQVTPAQDDGRGGRIGALEAMAVADEKRDISEEAIRKIIQHLEGVPGRKNLVWIGQGFGAIFNPPFGPPVARDLLGAANIAVYPVMVRSLQASGALNMTYRGGMRALPTNELQIQFNNRKLGESLGGTGFDDAADALTAVRTAEEDANNYYVLGFYPAEKDLDGTTHQLTLDVSKAVSKRPDLATHYRQVYLASKPVIKGPASGVATERPSFGDLFRSPLDSTAIGLTASVVPDTAKPGARRLQVTVDLTGIQLRQENGGFVGSFQMATRYETKESDALMVTEPVVHTLELRMTEAEFTAARTTGLVTTQPMPDVLKPGVAHIIVQDVASGAAGSLRLPMPEGR